LLIPRDGTDDADLFITAATIRLERWRFNYGRKITLGRISSIEIASDSELRQWISERLRELHPLTHYTINVLSNGRSDAGPRAKFGKLVSEWKAGRGHSSKIKDLVMHTAYQQIIGMEITQFRYCSRS